jgi:hypothetical protein
LRSLVLCFLLERSTDLFFLPNTVCSPNAFLPPRAHRTCKSLPFRRIIRPLLLLKNGIDPMQINKNSLQITGK